MNAMKMRHGGRGDPVSVPDPVPLTKVAGISGPRWLKGAAWGSESAMRRLSTFAVCSLALFASACATTGTPVPETEPRSSRSGLYTLDLSRSFDDEDAPNDAYDSFFTWTARDWVVGIIVDGPAAPMDVLDDAVRQNALNSELPAEIVRVRDVELGGLHARRTEIVLEVEGSKLLMLNTHTATSDENVQVIVSGPLRDARALRELGEQLERGGFRFKKRVAALKVPPPYDLDDPTLPVRFSRKPETWVSAQRGSVNEHAFLELTVPDQDMWFMGIHEVLEGELADEAVNDPAYIERYARVMHDEMASVLQAVPPGDLEPFDPAGADGDRRWSLGGHYIEGNVPITYRFRLVQRGPELLRLYCWGQPSVDVKGACDALFDAISLAAPAPDSVDAVE